MQAAVTGPWETLMKEIHRILVPGGAAQFVEFIYEHKIRNPTKLAAFQRSPVKRMEQQFQEVSPYSSPNTTLLLSNSVERKIKGMYFV